MALSLRVVESELGAASSGFDGAWGRVALRAGNAGTLSCHVTSVVVPPALYLVQNWISGCYGWNFFVSPNQFLLREPVGLSF